MRRPPDILVYELGAECAMDGGVLRLLRRICPDVPLVIVGEGGSLEVQRRLQEFRPIFFAIHPMDQAEWRDVVRAATASRTRGSANDTRQD